MTADVLIEGCDIPGGTYPIGNNMLAVSRPVHEVTLSTYRIGRTAVSNRQYALFVTDGGYRHVEFWPDIAARWLKTKGSSVPAFWGDHRFDVSDQPVVGVCWYEALAFTRWLARCTGSSWRLPTEAEWEVAAAGAEDSPNINTAEQGTGRPQVVYSDGNVSKYGALHMLGNVYEWCSSRWGRNWQSLDYTYPYNAADGREDLGGSHARIIRGGSWFDTRREATPYYRARYLPGSRASNIGFRVALDV